MPDPWISRRDLLSTGACLASAGTLGALGAAAPALPRESSADLLDAAFARMQAGYPCRNVHRANHLPMVVEALAVLGRGDAILPWVEENLDASEPDAAVGALDAAAWRAALGDPGRFSDWRQMFLCGLEREDWRDVVRTWVPRFVPGLAAAATHGVIRTAHAARALGQRDNEIRRAELASALAYWAASYEELPWDGSVAPETSVADALARVATRRPARELPQGNIVSGLHTLSEDGSGDGAFLPVAGWVDVGDPLRTLGEITVAAAELYLRHPGQRIPFAHALTGPSALRLLAPYLDEATVREATRRAWQAVAGLRAVYGDPAAPLAALRAPLERAELVAAAVENGGAHSIKLTEACLREAEILRAPILLAAARDAGESMHG